MSHILPIGAMPPYLRDNLVIPPYLRGHLDKFLADISEQSFEEGRRAGEEEATDRLTRAYQTPRQARIAKIQEAVAARFSLATAELVSDRQGGALPRQIAIYLTRLLTGHSLPVIGRHFRRDHTTVIHSIRKIERLCKEDAALRTTVNELHSALTKAT